MDPTVLLLIVCVILSSFFSWAETAFISLTDAQVRTMVKNNRFASKTIERLKSNTNELLITILIWSNVVNIWIWTISALWATEKYWSASLWIVTWILTIIILIFWEIIPKTIAHQHAAFVSSIVAKPLYLLVLILIPITYLLEFIIRIIWWKTWLKWMTSEELKAMVDIWAESWNIDIEKKELISNVLEFWETTVEEIMTDSSKIISMPSNLTLKKAYDFFVVNEVSRIPVYNWDNKDEIIWIMTVKEMLKHKKHRDENMLLKDIDLITPIFIPETKYISDLFKEFQWKRMHMAVVIDEFWKVSWLVTLEDILEEVFWEIHDEFDDDEHYIKKLNKNSWRISWLTEINKVNEALWAELAGHEHRTLSYYILALLQKIPERWDNVSSKWFEFFVEKMTWNRIDLIRVQKVSENLQKNDITTLNKDVKLKKTKKIFSKKN